MAHRKTYPLYRFIRAMVKLIYPRMAVEGLENLPGEAAIIVGNHTQMNGPIACELYAPGQHYIWCASEMMALREVPGYAYRDFWSQKPKGVRWFYKGLSYVIAPLSVVVFNNAHTIPVYRDMRLLSTFRETIARLREGANVVIFPEEDKKHNHIVYEFQDRFIDVARTYYKQTGVKLCFVPMYIAPKLRRMVLGRPVRYDPDNPLADERRRVCEALMAEITDIAEALPPHTVVPYRNIPKKDYPTNIPPERTNNV